MIAAAETTKSAANRNIRMEDTGLRGLAVVLPAILLPLPEKSLIAASLLSETETELG